VFEPVVRAEGAATLKHPDWAGLAIDLAAPWT